GGGPCDLTLRKRRAVTREEGLGFVVVEAHAGARITRRRRSGQGDRSRAPIPASGRGSGWAEAGGPHRRPVLDELVQRRQEPRERRARLGIGGEARHNELLERRRDGGSVLPQGPRGYRELRIGPALAAGEGALPRQRLVERGAEAEDVRCRGHGPGAALLGGHVWRGPHRSAQTSGSGAPRHAEA